MSDNQNKLYQLITVSPFEETLFLDENELIRHLAKGDYGDVLLIREFYLEDSQPDIYTSIILRAETGGEK